MKLNRNSEDEQEQVNENSLCYDDNNNNLLQSNQKLDEGLNYNQNISYVEHKINTNENISGVSIIEAENENQLENLCTSIVERDQDHDTFNVNNENFKNIKICSDNFINFVSDNEDNDEEAEHDNNSCLEGENNNTIISQTKSNKKSSLIIDNLEESIYYC